MSNGFFREAVEARRTAIAWLHWQNADFPSGPSTAPNPVFSHLSTVKILSQRGPAGFCSLSYGPKIMALVEAPASSVPTNAYITTPRQPGIIGLGALGNPTAAQLVNLTTNGGGFEAQLQLTHGSNGTTQVYVRCTTESVAIVEVPVAAISGSGPAGSFSVGIENDPLTGGTRLLEWSAGSAVITNRTGVTRNITNAWVCVQGHYGMSAGPAGYFNYQAASSYNRPGAAQDTLQFMAADPLGPRYAVWFPGKNAAQTSSNAARITWTINGNTAVLSFPGDGGAMTQISATVPNQPAYPAYTLPAASIAASSLQTGYPPTNAVDANLTSFWVSQGSTAGQGPTPSRPEWLKVSFPRQVAVSGFQVYPRTVNGGYGPKDMQILLDDAVIYSGTMAGTATLNVSLPVPVYATNAQMTITSSYDPNYPTNSRNVQVMELVFTERAQPGTFGDWVMRSFSAEQIQNGTGIGEYEDPDGDRAANLVEFGMGGDPVVSDGAYCLLKPVSAGPNVFAFRYRERKDLGDVQRTFEVSSDLQNWSEISPASLTNVSDSGVAWLKEAVFAKTPEAKYYRVAFRK
jgi:hypothetical protein